MEKEKRGVRTRKWWIGFSLVTFILTFLCWGISYTTIPGHSVTDFYRFKSTEAVVAFLHEPFDLQVTTSEEVLAFITPYDKSCERLKIVHETAAEILDCWVPTWYSMGTHGYRIRFWISKNNLLEYIEAFRYCNCI
jgi:hypothetical protein